MAGKSPVDALAHGARCALSFVFQEFHGLLDAGAAVEVDERHLRAGGPLIWRVSAQGEVYFHGLVEFSELKFDIGKIKEELLRDRAFGGVDGLLNGELSFPKFSHGGVDQAEFLEHDLSGAKAAQKAFLAIILEQCFMLSPLKAAVEIFLKSGPALGGIIGDEEIIDGDPEAEEDQNPDGGPKTKAKDEEDE